MKRMDDTRSEATQDSYVSFVFCFQGRKDHVPLIIQQSIVYAPSSPSPTLTPVPSGTFPPKNRLPNLCTRSSLPPSVEGPLYFRSGSLMLIEDPPPPVIGYRRGTIPRESDRAGDEKGIG